MAFSTLRTALILMMASVGLTTQANHNISRAVYDDLVHYFKYSSSAYSLLCQWPNGNRLIETFWNIFTGTQGFIARDDNRREIVIALRGSFSVADIITDVGIILTPFDVPGVSAPWGTKVHRGFLKGWNSVANDVIATVGSQLQTYPGYRLTATGHSLGGAVASLAAISFRARFPSTNVTLYTYGQPRTGNFFYSDWLNSELGTNAFRVVHTYDGVPTIIPIGSVSGLISQSSGIEGYHHHGIEYWQDPDPASENTTRRCKPHGEDLECSLSIPSTGINVAHLAYFGIMAITPFCSVQAGPG